MNFYTGTSSGQYSPSFLPNPTQFEPTEISLKKRKCQAMINSVRKVDRSACHSGDQATLVSSPEWARSTGAYVTPYDVFESLPCQ